MSKKNVLSFLSKVAQDKQLKAKLDTVTTQEDFSHLGREAGYPFSQEHIEEALISLKQKPGFLGSLAEALFELFGPNHDDYPSVGVQPYSGDQNPNRKL